jgi:hypothetical protein
MTDYKERNRKQWETKRKNGTDKPWNTGLKLPPHSKDHNDKIGASILKSEKYQKAIKSPIRSEKLRKSQTGNKNRMKNPVSRDKMRKTILESFQNGRKPWNKNIYGNDPYSIDWTASLRRSIRERDRYTCQLCGDLQSDKAFDVHHIDYNKQNCDPNNLVTLCHPCHMKTNNNREYYKNHLS